MVDVMRFEAVKGLIHSRFLSYEWHAGELRDIVKAKTVGEIVRTWYVDLSDLFGRPCLTNATYKLMRAWNISLEELEVAACANDAGSYMLRSIGEIVGKWTDRPVSELPLYVVTNDSYIYGAAGILDILAKLSDRFPEGYIVAMFSAHECMVMPRVCGLNPDDFARMVYQINCKGVQGCAGR